VIDTIKLSSKPASSSAPPEFWQIQVLFEDEHLLALNKPPCLLMSPDRDDPNRPNLMKLLHTAIAAGKPWAKARGLTYLASAHRLDFETSGVILLAKNKPTLIQLVNLFSSNKAVKTYVALLPGTPPSLTWEVDAAIAPHPINLGLMRIDPKNGKRSQTRFRVREKFRGYALVECQPLTARTHQIRIHLKHWGLPICGDTLYGGGPLLLSELKPGFRLKPGKVERPLISTVALHAERLEISHPVTGQTVAINAEWPKDLTVALKYLRRYALSAPSV
jgi:RluA family pseudouridine synthase